METATKEEMKQKFSELMMAVVKQGEEHPETIPEPGVEETHACLLCKGISSTKMFYNHMALYHGGLEAWMLSQDREDVRELVPSLLCHKLPDVCFVPDHYGQ